MSQISKPVFCHGCKQTRPHHSIYPMKHIVVTFLKLGVDADKELRCPVCLFRTECESDAELVSQSMKEESSTVSGTTSPKTVFQTSFSFTNSTQLDSSSSWNQTLWMGAPSLEPEEHNATRHPPLCQTASSALDLYSTRRDSSSEVTPCGSSQENECESDAELISQSMKEESSTVSGATIPKTVSQTSFSSTNSTQQDSSSSWNKTLWMGDPSLEPEEQNATSHLPLCQTASSALAFFSTRRDSSSEVTPCGSSQKNECESDAELISQSMKEESSTVSRVASPKTVFQTSFSSTNSTQQDSSSSWNQTLWMGAPSLEPEEHNATRHPSLCQTASSALDLSSELEEDNATRYPPLCQTASSALALSSTKRDSSSEVTPCGSSQENECESDAELISQSMKEESSTVSVTTSPKTVSQTSPSSTNSTQLDSSPSWNETLSSKLPLWTGALSLEPEEHNATRHPPLCQTASSALALSSIRRDSSSEVTPCGSSQKFTSDPEHSRQHPDNLSGRHLKTVQCEQQTKAYTWVSL